MSYDTNPNNALWKEIPEDYHTFALFDPRKMANLMIPVLTHARKRILLRWSAPIRKARRKRLSVAFFHGANLLVALSDVVFFEKQGCDKMGPH